MLVNIRQLSKACTVYSALVSSKSPTRLMATSSSAPSNSAFQFVDPHHHLYAPSINPSLHVTTGLTHDYLPEDYRAHFEEAGLDISASVHVEVIPDSGFDELVYLESLITSGRAPFIKAIVGSCDFSQPIASADLESLQTASPHLRGIRWICNFDGDLQPGETPIESRATWPRVRKDFSTDPSFAAGLALLPPLGLSFDLQTNPSQLCRWARVLASMPSLRVVVDHCGSLRHLKKQSDEEGEKGGTRIVDSGSTAQDEKDAIARVEEDLAQVLEWRIGMAELAKNPNVYVKLSMLSYCVPGWWKDPVKEEQAKAIVLELIRLFGAKRCMFTSNWPVDGEDGLNLKLLFEKYRAWVAHLPEADQEFLFRKSATDFYRL